MSHVLINSKHKEEVRIGVVSDKELINFNIESCINYKIKGNIYYGRISRIESSLEAAFVDYGREKQGFLPFKEISDSIKNNSTSADKGPLTISDVLKEGQNIIVQVEKEQRKNKGALLTTNINIAGMYMIFNPHVNRASGISRQIVGADRKELKDIIAKLDIPQNSGVIIRTTGSGKNLEELQWEVNYLSSLWEAILTACKQNKPPLLIYQEGNIIIRTIRDYLRDYTDSFLLDDEDDFNQAYEFVRMVIPHYLDKIKFFEDKRRPLFEYFGVEKQVQSIFKREVQLDSGATIVFDTTEALTTIDVNSAGLNKGGSIEDTAYNANLNATKDIAKQLQLRDIGGLIVIDFIDMSDEEHKKSVVASMKKFIAKDKARIQVGKISQFGLLEMSRQRIMNSVAENIEEVCPTCHGKGAVLSVVSFALDILRKVTKACANRPALKQVTVQTNIDIITYLLNEKRSHISDLYNNYGVTMVFLPDHRMEHRDIFITYKNSVNSVSSYKKTKKTNNVYDNDKIFNVTETAVLKSIMPNTPKPKATNGFWLAFKKIFGNR